VAEVQGTCDPTFEAVRGALAEQLESGNELGASIVVDVDGRTVVDIWGGWCDVAHSTPWAEDTIVNVWSTTKTDRADARRQGTARPVQPRRQVLA